MAWPAREIRNPARRCRSARRSAGTVLVEGTIDDAGSPTVPIGVWRWPFDPVLPGLTDAVTASRAAPLVVEAGRPAPRHVEVVAYRPTERAVARLTDGDGAHTYLKALRPAEVAPLLLRHERLEAAGLPVAQVLATDPDRGLVLFDAIEGPTARTRYQDPDADWPDPDDYLQLLAAFGRADLRGLPMRPGRRRDALGHAELLTRVLPEQRDRLQTLTTAIAAAEQRRVDGWAVHGDLYEAQLVTAVDSPRIVGVLDLDDAGPGDPIDDRATVLAHLWSRGRESGHRRRIFEHVDLLRGAFGDEAMGGDLAALDVATAACLVGLATGPFRIQSPRWRRESSRLLRRATALVTNAGERSLISVP